MLSPEARALALHMAGKLIALYEEREAALDSGDLDRVYEIQAEINATSAERQEILASSECC